MKESTLEKYLKDKAKKRGYLCYKFESPGQRGVPDRLLVNRYGKTIYIELKTQTGRLSELQRVTLRKLEERGCYVYVLRDKEQIDEILERHYDD